MKLEDLSVGAVIMCADRIGEIAGWNVTLESGFYNRLKGDTFNLGFDDPQIEVVDYLPEEK